jgi:hypothetical protein
MAYSRDLEDLKEAVGGHRVQGYPLNVPYFGEAVAESTSTTRGLTAIVARPVKPMPFDQFARSQRWSDKQLNFDEWTDWGHARGFETLKFLPSEIQTQLEKGGRASEWDAWENELMRRGCLDLDRNVTCWSFNLEHVTIPPNKIRRGMLVEFTDTSMKKTNWRGRVVGVERDPHDQTPVILVELFQPTPFLKLPESTVYWMIRPGFFSRTTWVLGYGTVEAMKKKGFDIPPGRYADDDSEEEIYYLDQPLDLAVLEKFCGENYKDHPHCVWMSAIFYVVPIHPLPDFAKKSRFDGGTFRPIPEDLDVQETEVFGLEE